MERHPWTKRDDHKTERMTQWPSEDGAFKFSPNPYTGNNNRIHRRIRRIAYVRKILLLLLLFSSIMFRVLEKNLAHLQGTRSSSNFYAHVALTHTHTHTNTHTQKMACWTCVDQGTLCVCLLSFSRRCCFLFSMYFFRLIIQIGFGIQIGRSKMRALTRDCSLSLPSRTHSGVIATCGKFDKFAPPGCHCIIPCLGTFACSRCVPFFSLYYDSSFVTTLLCQRSTRAAEASAHGE